ncbi:unnamed protein product, partial [Iphiclides podalirius]
MNISLSFGRWSLSSPDAVYLFRAKICEKMEDNRNKSGKENKRKMKGEKRRNYDSSRFKEAYMKVIKDNWSVYKASKEYGIPWSTLRRHIATHGGESFDLPKLGRPFTLDSDLECVRMVNDLANGAPEGSIVRLSKNGWINSEKFLEWMHHFEAHIPPARPVLLIMDSHSTHVSQDVIDFATKNGIHLFTFPSHTSHLLQPLDVSVYKSLKNAWAKVLNDYKLQHPTSAPTRLDFCRLLTPAYEHAFQPSIIVNGFRKTGTAPFDRNAISDESIAPSLMQPSDLQSQNIESSTDNAQASAVNRETASPSVFSLLSVPEVPQSSSSSTRRAKRNPQARYLTTQSMNNMDSPEENIVAISNETTVAVTSEETVTSIRVPSASPTPGPSTESNLKRKLPRVKVEKTPKSNKSTMCDYCGVHYSQDLALRNGAVWVECMSCGKWYYQECTGTESPQFLCDNCDKVDFSGTDDSDWAPE